MKFEGLQIVTIIFSAFMTYFAFICYKRRFFGIKSLIVWLVIFVLIAVATLFPDQLLPVTELFKFARLFDFFVVLSIFFLITVSFINFLQNQKLKRKIEQIIQEKALEEHKNKGKI